MSSTSVRNKMSRELLIQTLLGLYGRLCRGNACKSLSDSGTDVVRRKDLPGRGTAQAKERP